VDYQRLLIDHLDLIAQIVRTTGRQRSLSVPEREELASYVNLRLVEDDYAILRKFQRRSSLWTYLVVVIERLSLDFCSAKWGRWRPSTASERLGPAAVMLERLVHRDGHTISEAMEIVRTNYAAGSSDSELHTIWAQIPERARPTEVGEEAAEEQLAPESSDARIEEEARQAAIERLDGALRSAFAALPAKDRVIIALRFDHDLSAVEIARAMQSSASTVHRRLDLSLKELRAALLAGGFDPREISGLIGQSTAILSPLLRIEVERFLKLVRLSKRDD
jgi:RNA polymerase sigma factor (sigma-70 family)